VTVTENISGRSSLLFLAPKWTGVNGGDTVNRDLARSLADIGHTAFVRVAEEVFLTYGKSLVIDGLRPYPGVPLKERANLFRTERLPANVDVVFGHARLTGGAAMYHAQLRYPNALRVQFVHADSGRLDTFRTHFGTAQERKDGLAESAAHEIEESALLDGASLAVGVGPLLTEYARGLAARCAVPPPVYELFPGVDIHEVPQRRRTEEGVKLLLLGRVDDKIKGGDIAAATVRELNDRGCLVHLTVRGANPQTITELERAISNEAGCQVTVKPFTTDRQEIARDIQDADIVLMPSRLEGFGLVTTEALGYGKPVLVSGCSGMGQVLTDRSRFAPEVGTSFVVPMEGLEPVKSLACPWADKITALIADRDRTEKIAGSVRDYFASNYTWSKVALRLSEKLTEVSTRSSKTTAATVAARHFSRGKKTNAAGHFKKENTSSTGRNTPPPTNKPPGGKGNCPKR
jgi:glycosyltransferase involved in cell wall biosynthesis